MIFKGLENNKRIKKGFTLTETLLVVAIIMILGAISIAIAPNIKRKLTQKELDNKAELIFQVAQSNLTGLKAADMEEVYQDKNNYIVLTQSLEDGVNFSNMCYFVAHSNDEFTKKIVPQSEIDADIWSNNWIVIYNYNSGTVYGVFYSTDMSFGSSFVDNMKTLATSFDNRVGFSPAVGYYGGGNTGNIVNIAELNIKPVVKVTNSDNLYANFTIDYSALTSALNTSTVNIVYEYEIYQPVYGTHKVGKVTKNLPNDSDNKGWLVLDCLTKESKKGTEIESDRRFSTLFPELVAGANAYIKVRAIVNGVPTVYSDTVKFNTLFSNDTVDMENEDSTQRKIVVSNVRHLENLSMQAGCKFSKVGTKKVVQDCTITFCDTQWKKDYPEITKFEPIIFENTSNCIQSYTAYDASSDKNYELKNFDIKYVGDIKINGKTVDEIDTSKNTYGTGIFAAYWGNSISNIILLDCKAEDGRDRDTGILAGKIEYNSGLAEMSYITAKHVTVKSAAGNAGAIAGSIVNCNVKNINKNSVSDTTTVTAVDGKAGFIAAEISSNTTANMLSINDIDVVNATITSTNKHVGYLAGQIENCKEIINVQWKDATKNTNKVKISGGDASGGLVGAINLCKLIKTCDLSLFEITTRGYAGGLIGYSNNVEEINDCSVDKIQITSTANEAGGIVGHMEGTNEVITNYTNVDFSTIIPRITNIDVLSSDGKTQIKGNSYTGGLVGDISRVNYISTCQVTSAKIYSLYGCAGGLAGRAQNCNYIQDHTIDCCEIKADINALDNDYKMSAGGIIGYLDTDGENDLVSVKIDDVDVVQTGIYSSHPDGAAGGIIGTTEKVVDISASHVYTRGTDSEKSNYQDNKLGWSLIDAIYAGGIIGRAWINNDSKDNKPIQIIQSDAASVIGSNNGTQYSGGLIGQTDNDVLIQQSYSCSYVRGKYVAGMIGNVAETQSSTIELRTSYAAGYLTPIGTNSAAYGVAKSTHDSSSTNTNTITGYATYTVCYPTEGTYYSTTDGFTTNTISGLYYAKSGEDEVNFSHAMDKSLLTRATFTTTLNSFVPSTAVQSGIVFDNTKTSSTPYNLDIKSGETQRQNDKYPYPQVSNQRGDYYEFTEKDFPTVVKDSLAYYERYGENTGTTQSEILNESADVSLFFTNGDDRNTQDKEKYASLHIDVDGYALVLDSSCNSGTISLKLNGTTLSSSINVSTMRQIKTYDGTKEYTYKVVDVLDAFGIKNGINTYSSTAGFYYKLEVTYTGVSGKSGTEVYYFNPRLANSAVLQNTAPTLSNGSYYLRTPKHFYGLAQTYYYYADSTAGSTFYQQKDFNYNNYNWSYTLGQTPSSQLPIGQNSTNTSSEDFISNYAGNYHFIEGIYPANSKDVDNMGFFSSIGSDDSRYKYEISNLFIVNNYNDSKTINKDDTTHFGVFAGIVKSNATVKNCAVSGFNITGKHTLSWGTDHIVYVGGFVGLNKGKIKNCESNVNTIAYERGRYAVADIIFVGGFTGSNGVTLGSNATIDYCICLTYFDLTRYNDSTWVFGGFAGYYNESNPISNSYCFSRGNNFDAGFAEEHIYNNKNYYLTSEKYTYKKYEWVTPLWKDWVTYTAYQTYKIANSTGLLYQKEDSLGSDAHGGTSKSKLSDFRADNMANLFSVASNEMGKPTNYDVPLYSNYNKNANYLTAVVKISDDNNSFVHFGEWPIEEARKQSDVRNATLLVQSPMMSAMSMNENNINEGQYPSLSSFTQISSSHVVMLSDTSETINITDIPEKEQQPINGSNVEETDTFSPNEDVTTDETIGYNVDDTENALTMTTMAATPIFVNVTADDTGEDITDQVNVIVTSNNDALTITDNVSSDYVESTTGKTIGELTDPDNGEYKNAKVFLVTASSAGDNQITVSLLESTNASISDTNVDTTDKEIIENSVECEPVVISAKVEKIRHVGITEVFSEEQKSISEDIILPETEITATYTSENASETPIILTNVPCIDDMNANILLYSIDGFDFDSENGGYDIRKIEVTKHDNPNKLLDALGLEETEENQNDETFVVYDADSISDTELEPYKWNYSEYYCRIGKQVIVDDSLRKVSYLPITLTGRNNNPVTFKITLQHNGEIIVLSYDLASVQNEFNVVHMDGANVIRSVKVGYGSVCTNPSVEEFEKANVDKTGYVYPEISTISEDSNWTPAIPTVVYEDVTFTLSKTPINYTIILKANGGEGEDCLINTKYGELVNLDGSGFKNGELQIKGWALEPEGEQVFGRIAENAASEEGATVTLYAIWGEKEEPIEGDEYIEDEAIEPGVTEGWLDN